MTDNQYQKEDNLPDTIEQVSENYLAQATALDGLVVQTAEGLNQIEQNLGWIYQQADAAGNDDMKLAVSNTWELAQQNAVRVTQLDAARTASIAMMQRMAEAHAKIAGEYDELTEAIRNVDEDHPLLNDLGEIIREDEREYVTEMQGLYIEDQALEQAFEEVFTEIHEGIKELTGSSDWHAVYRLTDMLSNNGLKDPTAEQIDLLKRLLATFVESETPTS